MKFIVDCEDIVYKKKYKEIVLLDHDLYIQGYKIRGLNLIQYKDKLNEEDNYSVITANIKVDENEIEIKYKEGCFDEQILEDLKELLIGYLGLSSLIIRAIIDLEQIIEKEELSLNNL